MITTLGAKAIGMGALAAVAKIVKTLSTMKSNQSLASFTGVLRVEPITMIDDRLKNVEYMPDVLQSLLNLFSVYYLQAVSCMTNVGDISVMRMLDSLNPVRDGALATGTLVDAINGRGTRGVGMLSMEMFPGIQSPTRTDMHGSMGSAYGSPDQEKNLKAAVEMNNMAVGKLLNVTIGSGEQSAKIPVQVRLATLGVDTDVLVHILGGSGGDNSVNNRIARWKAGELSLISDIVLCKDMVAEQRRLMLKDKSGAMSEINRRRAANTAAAWSSGTPSIAAASGITVIHSDTAKDLERHAFGRFTDSKWRKQLMDNSAGMIVAVIDTDYETVTIYTSGIELPTKVGVRQIKQSNKSGGPDLTEMFKMMSMGRPAIY